MAFNCVSNVSDPPLEYDPSYYSQSVLEEVYMTKLHINPLSFQDLEITAHLEPLVKSPHGNGTKGDMVDVFITCWEDDNESKHGSIENYGKQPLKANSMGMIDIANDKSPWNAKQKYLQANHCGALKLYQRQMITNGDIWEVQFVITGLKQHKSKGSAMIEIQIFSNHIIYQHCFALRSDMKSIIQYTIENFAKEQWGMNDIPLDIWTSIEDYVPIYFWTHGEPSLMVDDIARQLDDNKLPCDLLCTDWIWREGFFIETTCPKRVIPCAVKCETCDDFDGVFIPTEIRPRPTASFVIWIDDDNENNDGKNNNDDNDIDQNEDECYRQSYETIFHGHEPNHWYNDNSFFAYPCGISAPSPSFNPYNNNPHHITYMPQVPSLNPCGYISDSETTVLDEVMTSPPFPPLPILNGGSPLASQSQSHALENEQLKEEGYDQYREWDHDYLNITDINMPLDYAHVYPNSSPVISPGYCGIGFDVVNSNIRHNCNCQQFLNTGYCYCSHWSMQPINNAHLYWPYVQSSARMYPSTRIHDVNQKKRERP